MKQGIMRRHIMGKSISLIFVSLLLSICLGCGGQAASNNGGQDLPQIEMPEKGNPKLDSQLNQLVTAQSRGEAALFAEQSAIELVEGRVRVIIECVPGQVEAATEVATDAGAQLETSHDNLLQAVVPISSLTTLADEESIHFIRLPRYPLPAATGNE